MEHSQRFVRGEVTDADFQQLIKIADTEIQRKLDSARPRDVKRWQKWLDKFRAGTKAAEEQIRSDAPDWTNEDHLHVSGNYNVPLHETAEKLCNKLAGTEEFFARGKTVSRILQQCLNPIDSDTLRTVAERNFDKILAVCSKKADEESDEIVLYTKAVNLSRSQCDAFLRDESSATLPKIGSIAQCPVVFEKAPDKPLYASPAMLDRLRRS